MAFIMKRGDKGADMQQSQDGISKITEPSPLPERTINVDPREEQQWQTPQREEDEDHPYAQGYAGLDPWDMRPGEDEKIQPGSTGPRGFRGLWPLVALLCALIAAGIIFSLIISWLSLALVAVLLTVGFLAFARNWRAVAFPMPLQTFQVAEHPRLVINNVVGTISIRRGEQGIVTVAGTKRARGIGISPEKMQVGYDLRGNTLAISTRVIWSLLQLGMRKIDLEISVPAGCDIRLNNGSGNVALQGITGEIKLQTGSGRIEASDLQGRMSLKTGSGSISMGGINGQVTLVSGSGSIDASSTVLSGSSQFKTGSGSITFEGKLDPRGKYEFVTGSGSVNLMLPSRAAFSLKATTGAGRVLNEFGGSEVGSKPRAQLRIKSGSGGLSLYRRAVDHS
jgi:hypothetical protein